MALGFLIVFDAITSLLKHMAIFIGILSGVLYLVIRFLNESFKAYKIKNFSRSAKFLICAIFILILFDISLEYIKIHYPYSKEIIENAKEAANIFLIKIILYCSIPIIITNMYDLFIHKKIRKDNNKLKRILVCMLLIYVGSKIIVS